jgi:hypothetical protein
MYLTASIKLAGSWRAIPRSSATFASSCGAIHDEKLAHLLSRGIRFFRARFYVSVET